MRRLLGNDEREGSANRIGETQRVAEFRGHCGSKLSRLDAYDPAVQEFTARRDGIVRWRTTEELAAPIHPAIGVEQGNAGTGGVHCLCGPCFGRVSGTKAIFFWVLSKQNLCPHSINTRPVYMRKALLLRTLVVSLGVAGLAGLAGAQAGNGDLQLFLVENRQSALVFASMTERATYDFTFPDACKLVVATDESTDVGRNLREYWTRQVTSLDLSSIAQETEVRTLSGSLSGATLTLRTWDGSKTLPIDARTSQSGALPAVLQNEIALIFADTQVANRGASLFSRTVRDCGGKHRTRAAAIADSAAAAKARAKDEDTDFGGVPTAAREGMFATCKTKVAEGLKNPVTAAFEPPTWLPPTGSELMITGSVSGTNDLGGRISFSYACTYDRFGKQWLIKSGVLLNRQ